MQGSCESIQGPSIVQLQFSATFINTRPIMTFLWQSDGWMVKCTAFTACRSFLVFVITQSSIHPFTHIIIHWWQRIPCKVPLDWWPSTYTQTQFRVSCPRYFNMQPAGVWDHSLNLLISSNSHSCVPTHLHTHTHTHTHRHQPVREALGAIYLSLPWHSVPQAPLTYWQDNHIE